MQRRRFMQQGLLAGASLLAGRKLMANSESVKPDLTSDKVFNLDYAIHDGMFRNLAGNNFIDQIKYAHQRGFRSIEDNGMRGRDVDQQKKIGETLGSLNMKMGVFVAHSIDWSKPSLTNNNKEKNEQFLKEIRESVEVAKRCNATWMTVVPGVVTNNQNLNFQTAYVIELLKRASEILEPHNLVMVLEPLNFRDHPNLFLTDVPQAYMICKAVGSPACKILYDIYHAQIQVGNIIPYIDQAWDEIPYYQIGDNPGRKEPTTGEINYRNVFQHIYKKGFRGILGMEHGNAFPGKEGEESLIKSYREVDNFPI